jgi:hypothetical protein
MTKPSTPPAQKETTRELDPAVVSALLKFVRPVAAFAVVATILGRAVGPSIRGVAVGFGRLGESIEIAGAAISQMFLIVAIVFALSLGTSALRARLPLPLRYGSLAAGGVVVFVTLSAAASRVNGPLSVLIGAASSALAIGAAWDALRVPFARPAAVTLGFIGLGGFARLGAVLLSAGGPSGPVDRFASVARGLSTVELALSGVAMMLALGFIASRTRKMTSPATIVSLGLALIVTRQALIGAADDAGELSVLLARASEALTLKPLPFGPAATRTFIAILSPILATALLTSRALMPALAGALALMFVARGAPDVPLCALALVIASISVTLASRDTRGFWATVTRAESQEGSAAEPRKEGPPVDAEDGAR